MLDQNTDRMWFVIGAVIVGAAIIFIANGSLPDLFASAANAFSGSSDDTVEAVITPEQGNDDVVVITDGVGPQQIRTKVSGLTWQRGHFAKRFTVHSDPERVIIIPEHDPDTRMQVTTGIPTNGATSLTIELHDRIDAGSFSETFVYFEDAMGEDITYYRYAPHYPKRYHEILEDMTVIYNQYDNGEISFDQYVEQVTPWNDEFEAIMTSEDVVNFVHAPQEHTISIPEGTEVIDIMAYDANNERYTFYLNK